MNWDYIILGVPALIIIFVIGMGIWWAKMIEKDQERRGL